MGAVAHARAPDISGIWLLEDASAQRAPEEMPTLMGGTYYLEILQATGLRHAGGRYREEGLMGGMS
jgi:hypothetical protein